MLKDIKISNKIQLQANEDLALKLRFEELFMPEINKYFNQIVKDFSIIYSATGQPLNLDSYQDTLTEVLRNHYRRVNTGFYKLTSDRLLSKSFEKQDENQEEEDANEEILALLLLWRAKTSKKRSLLMTNTTAKDMKKAVDIAQNELIEEGIEITNKVVSKRATSKLKEFSKSRLSTIIATETALPAEKTKQDTGSTLLKYNLSKVSRKIWITRGDETVRDTHAEANGQTVRLNKSYFVGGEFLRYPLDERGSFKNIVNCHCSSVLI